MYIGKNIREKFCNSRGYYTVEAALVLPFILVLLLTLSYVIKIVAIEEKVIHAMVDESHYTITQSYLIKYDPSFSYRLSKRIKEENGDIDHVNIQGGMPVSKPKGVIKVRALCRDYRTFPLGFHKDFVLDNRVRCRAFIGSEPIGKPMSFDEMEKSTGGSLVWIFPTAGERYHKESCRYLKAELKAGSAHNLREKGYCPCRLCKPHEGETVYYFPNYGQSYHRQHCKAAQRNIVSMDRSLAEERGYTACKICGG